MKTNADLKLPNMPTLAQIQLYRKEAEEIRGFSEESPIQECLLLGEKVGELFKAVRKSEGVKIDSQNPNAGTVSGELADCFMYLMSIANRYNIDLEQAFREKEEINKQRIWK